MTHVPLLPGKTGKCFMCSLIWGLSLGLLTWNFSKTICRVESSRWWFQRKTQMLHLTNLFLPGLKMKATKALKCSKAGQRLGLGIAWFYRVLCVNYCRKTFSELIQKIWKLSITIIILSMEIANSKLYN